MSLGSQIYDIDQIDLENPYYKLQWNANKYLIWFFILGVLLVGFLVMRRFFKG